MISATKSIIDRYPNSFLSAGLISFSVITVLVYLLINYQYIDRINSIRIELKNPIKMEAPVVYIIDSTEVSPKYATPFLSRMLNDSVLFVDLGRNTKLRQFRIYFQQSPGALTLHKIFAQT